jgi:protoporphyrinogen IX oxidase
MKKNLHFRVSTSALLMITMFSFYHDSVYLWAKSLHVIAVISWMAGLLYLPRLFVYHSQVNVDSESSAMLKIMEYRLLNFIITPALIFSWFLGIWLAWFGFKFSGFWLILKFLAVIGLTVCSVYLARSVQKFSCDKNTKNARHWRIINEVPTFFMIIIVILVIVKPF